MADEGMGAPQAAPTAKEQASDAIKDYNVDFSYHKVDGSSPFTEQKLKETHQNLNATTGPKFPENEEEKKATQEPQIETGQSEEKSDPFSKRFAMLAEREQRLLQKEKEWKAQEQQRKNEKFYTPEQLKEMVQNDPYALYDELGVKADDIINRIVENPRGKSEQMLMDEIKNLNKKIDDLEKNRKEENTQSTIQRVKAGIKHMANQDPEKYELVTANEAYDTVLEVMKLWHHEKGKTLQISEALDIVEGHLDKQLEKVTQYKKFQNRFQRQNTPQSEGGDHGDSKTINNDLTAQSSPTSHRHMSTEESLSKAAQMLRWKD